MTNQVEEEYVKFWEGDTEERRHELIAGSTPWEEAIKNASYHKDLILTPTIKRSLPKNAVVGDIGCGVGRVMKEMLKSQYWKITGFDISQNMLYGADSYLKGMPGYTLSLVENNTLNAPSDHFDLLYSFLVWQHMPTHDVVHKMLGECFRVLKPGGYLRVQTHRGGAHPSHRFGGFHGYFYSSAEAFADDFRKRGFSIEATSVGDGYPEWLWVTARKAG